MLTGAVVIWGYEWNQRIRVQGGSLTWLANLPTCVGSWQNLQILPKQAFPHCCLCAIWDISTGQAIRDSKVGATVTCDLALAAMHVTPTALHWSHSDSLVGMSSGQSHSTLHLEEPRTWFKVLMLPYWFSWSFNLWTFISEVNRNQGVHMWAEKIVAICVFTAIPHHSFACSISNAQNSGGKSMRPKARKTSACIESLFFGVLGKWACIFLLMFISVVVLDLSCSTWDVQSSLWHVNC